MKQDGNSGFSLIGAVFLVLFVALLASVMVTIGTIQRQVSSLSVLSSRAAFAAASGLEWAIHYVVSNDACYSAPDDSFTLTGGAAAGYDVFLTCVATNVDEGPDNYNVFRLTARGSRGTIGDDDYHERIIRASVTTAP